MEFRTRFEWRSNRQYQSNKDERKSCWSSSWFHL